jgi:cardiolipin synthase
MQTAQDLTPMAQDLTLLNGGVEAFPRMVLAIEQARESVQLEMYLFRLDATGRRFVAALSAAAARGVAVRVSLDGWGSSKDAREIKAKLVAAGCAVSIHAWRWWFLLRALARNHRKLLLVDDRVAFVGGINVGDEYGVHGGAVGWADLAAEIRGGACTRLARELRHERVREPQGAIRIHLANRGGGWRLRRRYLRAFRGARNSIQLAQGYFLPNRPVLRALIDAVRRGVEVEVLLPAHSDVPFARLAMRYVYAPLLAGGVRIREWNRSVLHAKAAVIDGRKLLVGSFNLEPLSLITMDALVEADDAGAAAQGVRWMREHFALARPVEQGQLAGAAPLSWLRSVLATLLGGARHLLEQLLVRNRERRLGRGHRERS